MEAWLTNKRPALVFDGTFASLIDFYMGDEYSPYSAMARIFSAGIARHASLGPATPAAVRASTLRYDHAVDPVQVWVRRPAKRL